VGDNRNLVGGDGAGALVVPPADAQALASAISRLSADPALAARLGAQGGAAFDHRFTVGHMVAAHERFYEEALARR